MLTLACCLSILLVILLFTILTLLTMLMMKRIGLEGILLLLLLPLLLLLLPLPLLLQNVVYWLWAEKWKICMAIRPHSLSRPATTTTRVQTTLLPPSPQCYSWGWGEDRLEPAQLLLGGAKAEIRMFMTEDLIRWIFVTQKLIRDIFSISSTVGECGLGGLRSSSPSQGQVHLGAAEVNLDLTRGTWAEVARGAHPLTPLKSPESKSKSTEAIAEVELQGRSVVLWRYCCFLRVAKRVWNGNCDGEFSNFEIDVLTKLSAQLGSSKFRKLSQFPVENRSSLTK